MENHQTESLRNILLGILIGILGSYFFFKSTDSVEKLNPPIQNAINSEAPKIQIESPQANFTQKKRMVLFESKKTQNMMEEIPSKAQPPSEAPIPPKKRQVEISLSSTDIERLEEAWNDLPDQVEIRREERGWRISKVAPDSLFATTGFQEGDLVTEQALNSYFGDEKEGDLASRVINIFEHVSR